MKQLFIAIVLLCIGAHVQGQSKAPFFGNINWINGYEKEISGENITYFSAFPDYATTALLTRATDGKKAIAWETAPVPKHIKGDYVYFCWVAAHSTATSKGERYFDVYVNDKKVLTFTTFPENKKPDWMSEAPDGTALVFQQTKRDGAFDAHGLAFLRLPKSNVTTGKPIQIKIVGHAQDSNDWFMTFKFTFEEKLDIFPRPFILKNSKQVVALTALYFGKEAPLNLKVNHKESFDFTLKEGVNQFEIGIDTSKKPDSIHFLATTKNKTLVNKFYKLKPITPREIHFLHHSHTDIGYSHLQPEVLKIHIKNIDDAIEMIEKTKDYPEASQFKWNIESLWAVENYLKQATPLQKEKFIAAVKSGGICLSALYANILTGLSEPEEMFHYTDYAEHLKATYGFKINSAMVSDIPGFAWTTVTALAKGGVKYFSSGPNFLGLDHPYLGDRVGHFGRTWGDKPVWWASPSGEEKVLFFVGAKGYSSWHGTTSGQVFENGPKKIAAYLEELTENKYPYYEIPWRYNIVADNGPIDASISDFVKQWNSTHSTPKIILDTTEKFFEDFDKKYGDQLPTVSGDIAPYWEDGALSTAYEESKNRVNSLRLQQLTTLYAMLNPKLYNTQKFYEAWTNIIMFHEHTWGAHNSITEPDIDFVTEQWRIKKDFMLDADREINTLEAQLLQDLKVSKSNKIAVFNTSSWKRTGLVTLDLEIVGKSVKDEAGNILPLQKLSTGKFAFMAKNVPAFGSAIYEITNKEAPAVTSKFVIGKNSISNGRIAFSWDNTNGSITNINTNLDFNYAGNFNNQGLNSYWYVPGMNPEEAVSNANVTVNVIDKGPVVTAISIVANAPGVNRLERIISLNSGSNVLHIENILDKTAVRSKEAVHFGYPFNTSLKETTIDAGYGTITYLKDHLPGSNMDFLYGRRWLNAFNAHKGIQLMLLEMPLIEPGQIIDERQTVAPKHKAWKTEGQSTSTWFSYVMNNYWHTNYKADQEGIVHMRYALRPHTTENNTEMEQAVNEFTQPLIAIPINKDQKLAKPLFELSNTKIIVTSITPKEDGSYLLRLFNPEKTIQQTQCVWNTLKPNAIINVKTGESYPNTTTINMIAMGVSEYLFKL